MVRNEAIDSLRRTAVEARPAASDDVVETLAAPCICPQARMEACEALPEPMVSSAAAVAGRTASADA